MQRAKRGVASCESAARDSREKPVLASADETRRQLARKFFYCQKSRLRVRDAPFQAALIRRDDIIRLVISECVSYENACGTVVSCNTNDRRLQSAEREMLRYTNGLSRC
jgi:hypothetical protein